MKAAPVSARKDTIWSGAFIRLFIAEMLLQMGVSVVNPNLAAFAVSVNATIAAAGFIAGLNYAVSLCLRPVNGLICDSFYKPGLLFVSCAIFAVSALGLSFSSTPEAVAAFRIIQGCAFVVKSSIVVSLASQIVSTGKIGQAVGTIGMGFTVACALGPAVGDFLGANYGYRVSFLFSTMFFMLAMPLILSLKRFIPDKQAAQKILYLRNALSHLSLKKLFYLPALPVTIAVIFSFASQSMMLNLLLLMADVEGVSGAAIYFVVYALFAVVSKPLSGRVLDNAGLLRVIVPMSALMVVAMVLLSLDFSAVDIAIAGVLMGIGQGSVYSCLQAQAVHDASVENSGKAANMFYLGTDLVQFGGPFLFAVLFERLGAAACFRVAAITPILGVVLYAVLQKTLGIGKG